MYVLCCIHHLLDIIYSKICIYYPQLPIAESIPYSIHIILHNLECCSIRQLKYTNKYNQAHSVVSTFLYSSVFSAFVTSTTFISYLCQCCLYYTRSEHTCEANFLRILWLIPVISPTTIAQFPPYLVYFALNT